MAWHRFSFFWDRDTSAVAKKAVQSGTRLPHSTVKGARPLLLSRVVDREDLLNGKSAIKYSHFVDPSLEI
jgi:hypothetical protein